MGFNAKSWSNDLDDFGGTTILENLHIYIYNIYNIYIYIIYILLCVYIYMYATPPPKPIADKIQKIQMLIDAENMFFFSE